MARAPQPQSPSRSQSNTQTRLKIFLTFLLLACVLGLGTRILLAPERVSGFLREQINQNLSQFDIQFKSAEIVLADGVLPAFAVEIKQIEVTPKRNCEVSLSPVRIQKARLPINFLKLFERKIALSLISIEKIEVDIENFQNLCPARSGASVVETGAAPIPQTNTTAATDPTPNPKGDVKFWDEEKLKGVREMIGGVEFDEIKFYFDHHQKFLLFKNFSVSQNSGDSFWPKGEKLNTPSYHLRSEFVLPPEYAQGEILPTAFISGDLSSEKIVMDISTQISEGHILLSALIKPEAKSPLIDLTIKAAQLPVAAMANYLVRFAKLPTNFQPKFVWLSFTATEKGRLDRLKELPIDFSSIIIDGGFGQALISHLVRRSDASFSDFAVDLTKINVQKLLEIFSIKGPDGIFSQFGDIRGRLDVKSAQEFEFKGDWQDAILKFSRRGARSEQRIDSLKMNFSFLENRIRGKISDVELENGSFDGEINLNLDRSFADGDIEIQTKNIQFDPSVQKSMFLGSVSGIKLSGKMTIAKFLMRNWDGQLTIDSLDSNELSFKGAQFVSHFSDGQMSVNTKIASGSYRYDSNLRKIETTAMLGFEDKHDALDFKNLRGDLLKSGDKWSWSSVKANMLEGRVQGSSAGSFLSNEVIGGQISLDLPNAKRLVWSYQGSLDDLKFNPESSNLKALVAKKADYKILGLDEER